MSTVSQLTRSPTLTRARTITTPRKVTTRTAAPSPPTTGARMAMPGPAGTGVLEPMIIQVLPTPIVGTQGVVSEIAAAIGIQAILALSLRWLLRIYSEVLVA